MDFMEYSNKTHSNIIPKEDFEKLIHEVFSIISENLCKSLGPLGSSATILNGSLTEATKDGYQILKNYRFRNRYMTMVYNLIMEPCTKMNNTVGDGTTTAIALTNALFNRYQEQKGYLETLYRLPRQFTKAWDEVIADICERVKNKAIAIDPKDYNTIYNIAYVVSNGSEEISHEIAKTYQEAESPSIKQKDSPTNKSYISPINGFEFPANLIDEIFVKNQDGTAEEHDVMVMVFDHKIESDFFQNVIVKINNVARARGHKLLIIAPAYDELMCDTILDQYIHYEFNSYGSTNLILTQFSMSKLNPHQLTDLSIVLRGKHITQILADKLKSKLETESEDNVVESILEDDTYELYRLIGIAAKAILTFNTGTIIQVEDIENDQRYIDTLNKARIDLQNIIDSTDYERKAFGSKIFDAKARVMQLEMRNYIYYVGADSKLQKQIIWAAIEDVIKCVHSSIKHGVVPGSQLSIIISCKEMINEISNSMNENEITDNDKLKLEILYIISSAVIDVYSKVLHGADGMGMIKLLPRWAETNEDGVEKLHKEAIEKCTSIVNESIKEGKVFDMESLTYNENIITSAETDQMVLSAASELVKILISGNQCIVVDAEIDGSHEETRDVYV